MLNANESQLVTFEVAGDQYRHWRLTLEGRVATLAMNVDEDGGLRPGYKLKLNSYDLGVDVELHDILQRIRFEHPEIACVVLTSARPMPGRSTSASSLMRRAMAWRTRAVTTD